MESLTLITPEGELRRINRLANSSLFSLVLGGQGLFGTLYSATLRVNSLLRSADDAIRSRAADSSDPAALHLLIPPEGLDGFVARAQSHCDEWRVAVEQVQIRPTLKEEETFLRWARRPYTEIGLRLAPLSTVGGAVRTTQLRRELVDAAIAAGGSFPITRTVCASREQVEACYPELAAFLAEKRRIDPSERLVNDWYLHYRNLLGRTSCETRWNQA